MKILASLLAGVALAATVLVAPAQAATTAEYEAEVVTATNTYRTAKGLNALKKSPCLEKKADAWAKHLATEVKKLEHRSPSNLKKVLKQCKKKRIGENLAVGYPTGTAVVTAWKNSPGHNANLLKANTSWYGVGAYHDGTQWWTVQMIAG